MPTKQKYLFQFLLLIFISVILFYSYTTFSSHSRLTKKSDKTVTHFVKNEKNKNQLAVLNHSTINEHGRTILSRFPTPTGYKRIEPAKHSFAYYLKYLPLKPHGTKVHHYDGSLKWNQSAAAAVIDMDVGKRDLQQCADAIMRLRAEYLLKERVPDKIHFNFVNGFNAEYKKWRQGYRIKVKGNQVTWKKEAAPSDDYKSFRRYLTMVFSYAGTLSLAKELTPVAKEDLQIGDVFIYGGSPGHAVIVVDLAVHETTEEKIFLLAQSYMPAQDIHILTNPNEDKSAWYSNNYEGELQTAEWTFKASDLKRF